MKKFLLLFFVVLMAFGPAKAQINQTVVSGGGTFNAYLQWPISDSTVFIIINNLTDHDIDIDMRAYNTTFRRFTTNWQLIWTSTHFSPVGVNAGVIDSPSPALNSNSTFPWSIWIENRVNGDLLILHR